MGLASKLVQSVWAAGAGSVPQPSAPPLPSNPLREGAGTPPQGAAVPPPQPQVRGTSPELALAFEGLNTMLACEGRYQWLLKADTRGF